MTYIQLEPVLANQIEWLLDPLEDLDIDHINCVHVEGGKLITSDGHRVYTYRPEPDRGEGSAELAALPDGEYNFTLYRGEDNGYNGGAGLLEYQPIRKGKPYPDISKIGHENMGAIECHPNETGYHLVFNVNELMLGHALTGFGYNHWDKNADPVTIMVTQRVAIIRGKGIDALGYAEVIVTHCKRPYDQKTVELIPAR